MATLGGLNRVYVIIYNIIIPHQQFASLGWCSFCCLPVDDSSTKKIMEVALPARMHRIFHEFFVLLLLLPHHTLRLVLSHLEKMSELLDGANAVPVGNCRQQDLADAGLAREHAVQSLENATPHFLKRLVESDDLLAVCAAYAVKGDY